MALGVPSEKRARSKEERIPLPYWREPRRAAAEPVIESSTLLRAVAVEHAATIQLVLKMRNVGKTTAQRLRKFPILNSSSKRAKARAQLVAMRKRFRREKRSTNRRLSILMIETPIILIPKKNP